MYVIYIYKIRDWWDQFIHVKSNQKNFMEYGRRKALNEGEIVNYYPSVPAIDEI